MALAAVTVSGLGYGLWQWLREPDLSTAEAPFNSMALPLASVKGDFFMDGGSVRLDVVDNKGVPYIFLFPVDYPSMGYTRAYHGKETPDSKGGTRLSDPERARKIALYWLRWHAAEEEDEETALSYLSGWQRSKINKVRRHGIGALFE
jgi:hypothetical protein